VTRGGGGDGVRSRMPRGKVVSVYVRCSGCTDQSAADAPPTGDFGRLHEDDVSWLSPDDGANTVRCDNCGRDFGLDRHL
jgi:hypothetical protein